MTLIKWHPVFDLINMRRDVDSVFDHFNSDLSLGGESKVFMPVVDILEKENGYSLRFELPGVEKNDVKITVHGDTLTVKGEKKQQFEKTGDRYHHIERSYGTFQRSFTLPAAVDSHKIDASYDNGVLTVDVPKLEEAKPKEIEVKLK